MISSFDYQATFCHWHIVVEISELRSLMYSSQWTPRSGPPYEIRLSQWPLTWSSPFSDIFFDIFFICVSFIKSLLIFRSYTPWFLGENGEKPSISGSLTTVWPSGSYEHSWTWVERHLLPKCSCLDAIWGWYKCLQDGEKQSTQVTNICTFWGSWRPLSELDSKNFQIQRIS